MQLTLNKASKVLGIGRAALKEQIRVGALHMNDDGCIECEELKKCYPELFERAMEHELDYWEGIKATAGNWKQGAREEAERLEKHHLVNTIRRLEAECYALQKRVLELEVKLSEKH